MLTDLAVTPLSETLLRIAGEQLSGDLQVRSGKVVKVLFFDHGRVVFAASNLKKDRLGEALLALGRITGEEYERATEILKADHTRKFGEALVEAGVLEENEIGRSVARQVNRIVLSIFRFEEGASAFEERKCPIPLDYMVSLSLHRILYEGIRLIKSPDLVRAGLGDLDRRVTLADLPPFRFDMANCTALELDILERAQQAIALRKLIEAPEQAQAFVRARMVYALFASGVLAVGEIPGARALAQMETGTFLLSALRNAPRLTTPEAVLLEVRDELLRSARVDKAAWLKVSEQAPPEELVLALEEKMERYHLLLDTAGEDNQLRRDVEIILGRAWSLMRSLRPEEEPEPLPELEMEEIVTETIPVREDAPVAPTTREGKAKQLLVEGEARMTVGDFASAVRVYTDLVEREPDVAGYRSRLAVAMASWPVTARDAEREFLEAIRLEPENPDLHYRLGLYYKTMKQRSWAIAELESAVKLDPRHALARRELEALSPKDPLLTPLKRLFRKP